MNSTQHMQLNIHMKIHITPINLPPTGRTVQVQLPDNNDISDFLTLAVEAAFDWVYFADPNYVRLSVIPSSEYKSVKEGRGGEARGGEWVGRGRDGTGDVMGR